MSFSPGTVICRSAMEWAAGALEKRWVQALLFAATFLTVWLHGLRTAEAVGTVLSSLTP